MRTVAIGALTLTFALSGTAITSSAAIAAMNETESLSGVAVTRTVATGAMTGAGALSGTAVSSSTAVGAISGIAAGSGAAIAQTSGVGALTETEALGGAAIARTASIGALTGTGALSGAAVTTSPSVGDLQQAGSTLALSGIAVTQSATIGALQGTLAPVMAAVVQPAGAAKRQPRLYFVTIDGHRFERATLASALNLLAEARAAAQQLALERTQAATQQQRATTGPVVLPKLPLPKITVSSRELRHAVTETKREIKSIYNQALRDAEIAMLMELDRRASDDDETLTWLM